MAAFYALKIRDFWKINLHQTIGTHKNKWYCKEFTSAIHGLKQSASCSHHIIPCNHWTVTGWAPQTVWMLCWKD